jgi:Flp pilus assembly protein TadG
MIERRKPIRRDPQHGSVTILVAALWMGLFAMAALAVDAGHMYLTKRNVQEVADAAVMAGLPSLASSTTTAQSKASSMAQQSGYAVANITTATGTVSGKRTLTVTITATERFFFAKVLGYSSKTVSATSIGQADSQVPSVLALGTSCSGVPAPTGIQFNGGPLTVTGVVEGNGPVNSYGSTTFSGAVDYGSGAGCSSNVAGASNTGGSFPDPWGYPLTGTAATELWWGGCTFGSLTSGGTLSLGGPGAWWATGGPSGGTLVSGVYCSAGNIDLSGGTSVTGTVTLVALGMITISATTTHLTAYKNGIIAATGWTSNCYSTQAINIGSMGVTMDGSFYAPNGCINSSGTNIAINGSEVGAEDQIGVGSGSSITGASGGGSGYRLYQ